MKKIYLLVLLVVAYFISPAQRELPYYYDFNGNSFASSGWSCMSNNESCWNFMWSAPRENAMYFLSFVEMCGPEYRYYLMSPRVVNSTEDSVQISFRYIIPNNQPSTETFVVGYCTADTYTSEEDFVWLEDTVVCTNYESWLLYKQDLPANIQYVAIAYTSGEQYALVIDDVLLRADSPDAVYTFTVNSNEGGSFTVTTGGETTSTPVTVVQEGDELSYTVTADQGCYISSFFLDSVPNYGAVNQTSFSQTLYPVISNHVVDVVFGHYTYTVSIAEAEHGRIVPDGGATHELVVPWDTTVGFRFYPDEGYHISQVALTANGITTYYYDLLDTFTLSNIRKDYRLQVSFALNEYVVTVAAGEGGSISPSGEVNVEGFSSPEFLVSANPGYLIDTIYVDGQALDLPHYNEYVYRFDGITSNHTLSATFLHQPYIVHFTHTSHGTVTAHGGVIVGMDSIRVFYEDTVFFHFELEEGYEISDLQLNGTHLAVANPYPLTHVTQNSLFHAVFVEQTFQVTATTHSSGVVTPQQSGSVGYFDTVSFVITPGYCMQMDSILLDGEQMELSDTVWLTHLDGNHALDIYFSQRYYTMEILPCEHGTITGPSEVACSWTANMKIVPDHCYRFTHFYLDGTERADLVHLVGDTAWAAVSSVTANHSVSASFERIPYNVTVHTTGAGTITPAFVGSVPCDTTIAFEIIPDECHFVESVTVNGESVDALISHYPCAESGFGDTLRFELEQIEQHQTVDVVFRQFEYDVVLASGEHGSISSTDTLRLPCGTDKVITITPDVCYEIASVLVDGENVTGELHYNGTVATYSFYNIHKAHSFEASFARQTYTVTVDTAQHGSITPNNDSVVLCGDDVTYVIVPDECYQIDSVWLDGVAVNSQLVYYPNSNILIGDSAILVLSAVSEDHDVRISFHPIVYDMRAAAFNSSNGTVAFSKPGTSVNCGDSVVLTMTPKDCYYISEVWYKGNLTTDYQVDEDGVGTYVFPNVSEDIYVSVFYEKYRYELIMEQPTQHGNIEYLPAERDCGDAVQLVYHPDDCYHLDSVMIGDHWIHASDLSGERDALVYYIADIRSDLALDAAFSIDSVHFLNSGEFPMSVRDSVLACGQDLTVYSVREDCKQLDSILLNGTLYTSSDIDGNRMRLVGDTLLVRFENLHEDQNMAVFYSQIQYEVRTEVNGNGQVSQPPYHVIDCGDSLAIAIIPEACHHFDSVTINDSIYLMDNDSLLIVNDVRSSMRMVFHFSPDMYEVSAQCNELGVFDGVTGPVACGTDLQYVFSPLDCAMLDSVFMDSVCVNEWLEYRPFPTLLVDSISSNHVINAVFKKIPYMVKIETDSFNFVDKEAVNIVECGSDFEVRITPDRCHLISEVLLDEHSVISELEGDDNMLLIPNVQEDHLLEIMFSEFSQHVVTALVDSEGQLLSKEESEIVCGRDTLLEIAPYTDCYSIDSVYLNGTRVEIQSSYLLQVEEDVELLVFMHKVSYSVNVQHSGHFSITEGDFSQIVSCGDSIRLEFAPDEGYYISALVVDGETYLDTNSFVFTDIHSDHLVAVLTELYQYSVITTTDDWGSATPDSIVSSYGSDVSVRLDPRDCYEVRTVTVDGVDCFDSLQIFDGYAELTIHSLASDKEVSVEFGRIEFTCNVSGSEGGSLSPSSAVLLCGDTLDVTITPAACYHVDSVWVNDNFVPMELLQQIGEEVYYHAENIREDYHIEARFERNEYAVTVENHGAGDVVTTSEQVSCAGDFSFFVAPAPCTTLQSVRLNGEDITDQLTYRDNMNPWLADTACFTVANVTEDQVVEVFYESEGDRHIDVTFLSGSNVLQHENITVACGGDTVLPIALDCHILDSVWVDGVMAQTGDSCHFTEIIADHTVQAMFSRAQYQIVAQHPEHGTISPSDTSVVLCGADKLYTIVPEQGYYIDSLFVDDEEKEPTSVYSFTNVRDNHTIRVVFAKYSSLVDVEVYGNGAITPGDTAVWYGDAVQFSVLPDECHTVDSVVVDGVNRGSVAVVDFASVTESHTIYGYFSHLHYSVTAGVTDNGSISFSNADVLCGDEVAFTAAPNDCYKLDSVLVNGVNIGAVLSDTIRDVRQDQVVDAYFSRIVYLVSVDEAIAHGTVTVQNSDVLCGESVSLTVQPDACYSVDSVLVNGENVGAVTTYVISDVTENKSVAAFFSFVEYTVEVGAGEHGTVTNVGENVIQCSESFTTSITPDDCYKIGEILVDGLSATDLLQDNVLTLDTVRDNHTVSVTFEQISYEQTAVCNVGGSVSPVSDVVACGDDETFVITPLNCYRIDTVWLNGDVLPADSLAFSGDVATLTIRNISQPNELAVRFVGTRFQFEVENHGEGTVYLTQTSVECDGEATFYILPAQCESISSAVLNEVDITNQLDMHANENPLMPDTAFYTISSMDADQLLQIHYQSMPDNHISITYTDGVETLYVADSVLACGETMDLSFDYDCYTIDSVLVNGENAGAVSSLSIESTLADQTVMAYFSQNRYIVESEVTEGGEIVLEGSSEVVCGGNVNCTVVLESCYSIDSVVVNGVNHGDITSYSFENIIDNQSIKAYFSKDEFVISVREEGNGQILLDGSDVVLCGDSRSCSVAPGECASLDSVVVNGVNKGVILEYVFENITENQEIVAYFSHNEYQFVASAENGGQIEPAGTTTVACGSQQTYTILQDECFSIDSVLVNGINMGAVTTCSVQSLDTVGDQTIHAYFSRNRYNVRITAGEGGSIEPLGDTSVLCGDDLVLVVTPDDCYAIESLRVDGSDVGAVGSYTLENVTEAREVSVTFVRKEFDLTPLTSTGGTITPNVTTSVTCGSDFTFGFEPNVGYSVSAVIVDGDTIETTALSYRFDTVTANHTVKPLFSRNRYDITATAGEGGSVLPESSVVEYGGRQTITIAANDCYHIDSVFVDGNYVGAYQTHTFNNVTDNHTLAATFAIDEYEITAAVGEHGTIMPSGVAVVPCGDSVGYTIVPETGWHISGLLVDGVSVEISDTFIFENVHANRTIEALFAINDYTVTATAGAGGNVSPSVSEASFGEDVTVAIVADDCYHIDSVFVDSLYVGAVESYTFENVAENHMLTATFAIDEHEISANAGEHGTITPVGDTIVSCGENVTYTIVPETGWHISGLLVDGDSVEIADAYTFTDVRTNRTIEARFAINQYMVAATADDGGSVTPTDTTVEYNGTVTVAITAGDCHHIESVMVNGESVGEVESYTFSNVTSDQTLTATFAMNEYEIVATAGEHGMVMPSGSTEVSCGDSITYAIVPETGWHISGLLVDGDSVEIVDAYTFTDVHEIHTIEASFAINHYAVTATAGEGGLVTPTDTIVDHDGSVTIAITAMDCHHIESVIVNGEDVGAVESYTFSNIISDQTLNATFAMNTYEIGATADEHGTVMPSGLTEVSCGDSITYAIVPETGWHISGLLVDGDSVDISEIYTFTDIRTNHTIEAVFAINEYTVTATAGEGGSVTPTVISVDYNESVTIAITAADCHHIDSVMVNGESVGVVESYTFSNVTSDQTLTATFAMNEYEIMATAGEHGTITPSGLTEVSCGDSLTYTIVPETGWHISGLTVDNNPVAISGTYTFVNVREAHTIEAMFAINDFEVTATAGAGGSVSAALVEASYGDNVTIRMIPDDCYHVDSVFVDNVYVGSEETYTFSNITANHTLSATFAISEYTIAVLPTPQHGTVTPPNMTTVYCGDSVLYTMIPEEGYHVSALVVDGVSIDPAETYLFTDIQDNHRITAQFAINKYTVTVISGEGGSVSPSFAEVEYHGRQTVTITPDPCYRIDSVFVDDRYAAVASSSYTFNNIITNHTVRVVFAKIEYEILASVEGEGMIMPSGTTEVACGDSITYTVAPALGWHFAALVVDGTSIQSADSYTFTDVHANHTIEAQFAINEYTVTATAGVGGSVTPMDTTVVYNESVLIEITAEDCYHVDSVFVDGAYVGAMTSYPFEYIDNDHMLTATFAMNEYEISALVEGNGTISPAGDTVVACGGDVTYSIVPATGWHISGLVVDDDSLDVAEMYAFTNIRSDHTIKALFAIDEYTVTATAGMGGSVTPLDTTVVYNESVLVEITADDCYYVDSVFVDGVYVGTVESYTFENMADNHTLDATFAMYEYELSASAEGNGTIMPMGDTVVACSENVTYSIAPATGWHISGLLVDGETVEVAETYTFTDIRNNHTILAQFDIDEFMVTATAGEGGSVTPSDTVVDYNESVTITIIPEDCYHVDLVMVNGVNVGAVTSYILSNIMENQDVEVVFARNLYDVVVAVGKENELLFLDTIRDLPCGSDTMVQVPSFDFYSVDSIVINGIRMESIGAVLIGDIHETKEVIFYLSRDQFEVTAAVEGNGTISPSGTTTVPCGESVSYSFAPATGWHLTGLLVDDVNVDSTETYTFADVRSSHTITAQFAINEYTVTATAGEGGSVTPSDTTVAYGETVTVEITADDCYHVDSVVVNGENMGAVTSYNLPNITENQVVEAFFTMDSYDIFVLVSTEDALVFFDTIENLSCGADTLVEVPLFDCYYVDSIVVNGVRMENIEAVVIENIHETKNVIFYLSREQFIIVASKEGNGTISPSDTVHTLCDSQVQFTFTPDEGWYVENLIVDGESLGTPEENQYTFVNINANHTIKVVFAPNVYIITSSIDPIDAGNITPYGQTLVNHGENQTFNIMPFPGYQVIDVEVDGESQGAITTYTFYNVTANHTIVAHLMTVGVEESVVNKEVLVWPNPVENSCHIRIPDLNVTHTMELQLFDSQGKMILSKQVEADETEIDFYGRPSGMYMLRVVANGNVIATKKVIRK